MTHEFDKNYWEGHWQQGAGAMERNPVNPYLVEAVSGLTPGRGGGTESGLALEAGCGAGTEAMWLASQGWQVTGVDISADALGRASRRAAGSGVAERVAWVEADLTEWSPSTQYGLVTTHYAHPSIPQLAFYERISRWVAPGGTLFIVGHLHHSVTEVSVAEISGVLGDPWEIVRAEEKTRMHGGHELHDVVVQAVR
ncbi:class I SAM-dependent methyltransferase [Kribbella sp. NPDC006257]|uniref:class I SAM-dependent methyltransferase n=1 Tax=Kribbella sp. NPDC006257 TaxID=3156738 RepID=UPI0033BD0C9C